MQSRFQFRKLVLILTAAAGCFAFQAARDSEVARWEQRPERHDHPRRLGHPARLREDRRRRGLRRDLRPGRGRLQPGRDQLPQRDGPPGRSRGRGRGLPRPADEAVHRPRRHEGAVRSEPGLAEGADERLGRRPELLPRHAPRGEAAGHHALRAVDGAHLQRGQHRRRHRASQPEPARGVLRQGSR